MSIIDDMLHGHKFIDGHLVDSNAERIVRAIRDYSDEVEVKWLPPNARTREDGSQAPAYAIVHNPVGQPPYVMFYVRNDEDFNIQVLHRIISSDQRSGSPKWNEFTAWEEANKRVAQQVELDRQAEAADLAYHMLRTKQHDYRVNSGLRITDGVRGNTAADHKKLILGPKGNRGQL